MYAAGFSAIRLTVDLEVDDPTGALAKIVARRPRGVRTELAGPGSGL